MPSSEAPSPLRSPPQRGLSCDRVLTVKTFQEHIPDLPEKLLKVRMAILFAIVLIDFLGMTVLVNVVPILADPDEPEHLPGVELWDKGQAYSLIQFTHAFGLLISAPAAGVLCDWVGRRLVLLCSIFFSTVFYFLMGLAPSFELFCLARFLLGLFGGARPAALAYITDVAKDTSTRAQYLGYINGAPALAVGLGPAIGGLLSISSCMFPCYFCGALAGIITVMTFIYLPESQCIEQRLVHNSGGLPVRDVEGDLHTVKLPLPRHWTTYLHINVAGFVLAFTVVLCLMTYPLTFEEIFHLSPFMAGLSNLMDGALFFLANAIYVELVARRGLPVARLGFLSCLSWPLVGLIPFVGSSSIWVFLCFKWLGALTGPLGFACQPQMVAEISIPSRSGELMGWMTFAQALGRLLATTLGGPLNDLGGGKGYLLASGCGVVMCFIFHSLVDKIHSKDLDMQDETFEADLMKSLLSPARKVSTQDFQSVRHSPKTYNFKES